MNVKELKKAIENLPDDMQIILQKDAEGNEYSPLDGADPGGVYVPDTTWYGEVYRLRSTAGDNCMDDEDWEELKNDKDKRCLVLWPAN